MDQFQPAIGLLVAVQLESLIFAAFVFALFGLEELVVDLIWIGRAVWRRLTVYRRVVRMSVLDLAAARHPPCFAILVPAWDESSVIRPMLQAALTAYQDHAAHIFVGCYPNDAATLSAVSAFASDRLTIVVNDLAGPTTKGDCLNAAWQGVQRYEAQCEVHFDALVLHDAEDVVSPYELAAFTGLLDRFGLMQLPVVPLPQQDSRWIAGHYGDEFAESHVKSLVVREAIGAAIPSAGVGCCLRRDLVDQLAAMRGNQPFDRDCLTEDYELGLIAKRIGASAAFLRVLSPDRRSVVATSARFPATIDSAVRQKSRWIIGISIAGWDRMGWEWGFAELWMRYRDRRVLIEAVAILAGYLSALLFLLLMPFGYPVLDPAVVLLLQLNFGLMLWRLIIRCVCVTHVYGICEGILAAPRIIVSNMVAVLAARRAVFAYVRMQARGEIVWEKTQHSFPISPDAR
jgi:bacteriophage N4 adsorption protein B